MVVCMYGCMDGWMDGWMYGCMDVCVYECMETEGTESYSWAEHITRGKGRGERQEDMRGNGGARRSNTIMRPAGVLALATHLARILLDRRPA